MGSFTSGSIQGVDIGTAGVKQYVVAVEGAAASVVTQLVVGDRYRDGVEGLLREDKGVCVAKAAERAGSANRRLRGRMWRSKSLQEGVNGHDAKWMAQRGPCNICRLSCPTGATGLERRRPAAHLIRHLGQVEGRDGSVE